MEIDNKLECILKDERIYMESNNSRCQDISSKQPSILVSIQASLKVISSVYGNSNRIYTKIINVSEREIINNDEEHSRTINLQSKYYFIIIQFP